MADKIYIRRGTKAELDAIVLEQGEPGWTTDTKEFYMGDGTTSGGIFVAGSGTGVDSLNALIGAITISGGAGIEVTISGQYIVIGEEAGGLDVDSINGLSGVVTISGAGITEITEEGQKIVVTTTETDDVDSLNGLIGGVTISGAGGVNVTEQGQVIVVSGQDVGTYVDSLNELTGEVTISGGSGAEVTISGQTIIITASGGGGGVDEFTELTDTPANYTGAARKVVVVNSGGNGLEFVKAINVESVLTSDHDYSGIVCSGIAGETLEFGESVYYKNDGKWWRTIATNEGQASGHIALVVASGIADDDVTLLTLGYIRDDSWAWAESGGIWLATTSGDLTEIAPSGSTQIQHLVAWAHTSTIIWFSPSNSWVEFL